MNYRQIDPNLYAVPRPHLRFQRARILWGKIKRANAEDIAAASAVASGISLIIAHEAGLVSQRQAVGAFAAGVLVTVTWLALYFFVSVVSDITRRRKR